jgi:hypothetical protein
MRLEAEKTEKKEKARTSMKKSSSGSFHKTEDKMIESLRDIQSTLRNKLQVIQQDDKAEHSVKDSLLLTTQQRFSKKSNEEIVNELKS